MGRMPRIQVENAIYYVAATGDHDEAIFKDGNDYAMYTELLVRYKKRRKFKLFAFCSIPKSVNLLIEPSNAATISQIMHDINSGYTKYYNKKYGKAGHLFQERYRMVLIEKEPNVVNVSAYIHLRPKLLNLSDDISGYKHSSYPAYLSEEGGIAKSGESKSAGAEGLSISDEAREVLVYLKDKSYRDLVDGMALDELKKLDKELSTNAIIGSDKFVQKAKSKIKNGKQRLKEAPTPEPEHLPEAEVPPEPESEPLPEPEPEQLSEPAPETLPQPKPEPAPDAKPTPKPKSNMVKSVLIAALMIIAVSGAFIFVYAKTAQMKEYLDKELTRKDTELKNRLDKERKGLYKTLTDRYETEKASYQEAAQRLESEKETYKAAAERLEAEKNSYKQTADRLESEKKRAEEELALIKKVPSVEK